MTLKELIDQAGHRLGHLMAQPGYRLELERLVTLARNEARRESAAVCNRLIHGDGICADGEVWIHDCEDAILATLEEV